MKSRIKVRCLPNFIVSPLHPSSKSPPPRWEYHSAPPFPILFVSFPIDPSTLSENDNNYVCQCVQFIFRRFSLSFFVPYPRSLSLTGLNADGTICFLETSIGDGGTFADTSPSFSSTGQDESTSGAASGVIQDITDAPDISSDRDFNDVVNLWMWYYPSTFAPTNIEFHSNAEKAQHAAAAAAEGEEQRVMHHHGDGNVGDLQRDSPPWNSSQRNWRIFVRTLLPPLPPPPPPRTPPRQAASTHHRRRYPTLRYQPLRTRT